MTEILPITGTIFLVMAAGYVSVRAGVFGEAALHALGRFVVNFALPALILRAVSTRSLGEIAHVGYLGAVLFGSLAVFIFGYIWARRFARETPVDSTFSAMGMSCANSGFVGFPILLIALPDVASQALALNMIVENLVLIPLVLILAETSRGGETSRLRLARQIAGRLGRNPILIALVLGLGISASGLDLPAVLARPIDMFASASAAVSLTVIGGTLATLPLREMRAPVFRITFGKLILHPLAVAGGLFLAAAFGFGVEDPRLVAAAVILASTPVMAIYPILAQHYGATRNASLAMLAMTVLSFPTMSVVLAICLN